MFSLSVKWQCAMIFSVGSQAQQYDGPRNSRIWKDSPGVGLTDAREGTDRWWAQNRDTTAWGEVQVTARTDQ